jgi:hypothetical protein
MNDYDKGKWEDERVKAYHVVYHLTKFLGFDPLFFRPLRREEILGGLYARNHFRDFILRKTSSKAEDVVLTKGNTHATYEQYSEGFIVAVMNTYVDLLKSTEDRLRITHLKSALQANIEKYLSDNGGSTPEGNTVNELMREVLSFWVDNGRPPTDPQRLDQWLNNPTINRDLQDALGVFNDRKNDYFRTGEMREFLLDKYEDQHGNFEKRFLSKARDFHIILKSDELGASTFKDSSKLTRSMFISPRGFEYMQNLRDIFPGGGSAQTTLDVFTNLMIRPKRVKDLQDLYVQWIITHYAPIDLDD